MITVTTTRPINLGQLGEELGTPQLVMDDNGTERTVTCHDAAFTQAQLEAAVEAHVPAPPPPTTASLLQAQVDEMSDLLMELLLMGM